jgi:hypothetical protein
MTTQNNTKLKILFKLMQPGGVVTTHWLEKNGIPRDLQQYYLKSGWLEPIGWGAYKKPTDQVGWPGALYAIQTQTEIKVHVGGLFALSLQGYSHYTRLDNERLQLFSPLKTKLPKWFTDYNWQLEIQHHLSSFLPEEIGIKEVELSQFKIKVSTPERAIMECMYLAPKHFDLIEGFHLFEGLVNLKPKLVNELLINCQSVKVKRLFLYLAEKTNQQWLQYIDTKQIDLGTGNRMLKKEGVYISKYLISVPTELAEL